MSFENKYRSLRGEVGSRVTNIVPPMTRSTIVETCSKCFQEPDAVVRFPSRSRRSRPVCCQPFHGQNNFDYCRHNLPERVSTVSEQVTPHVIDTNVCVEVCCLSSSRPPPVPVAPQARPFVFAFDTCIRVCVYTCKIHFVFVNQSLHTSCTLCDGRWRIFNFFSGYFFFNNVPGIYPGLPI